MIRKLKNRFLALLAKYTLRMLIRTCKLVINGLEHLQEGRIIMLWHNRVTIGAEVFHRIAPHLPYCAIVSQSRDGELLAQLIESYKNSSTLRVPHDARSQALRNIVHIMKHQQHAMIMTPDGPRGPRYVVKPGIVLAAKKTGSEIVPVSWVASSFWQFNTWDKLMLPKPFSTIYIRFGSPVALQENRKEATKLLEAAMNAVNEQLYSEAYQRQDQWPE